MKIGILTYVNAPNFGALLQAYASQKFINDLGIDSQFINYTPLSSDTVNQNTGKIKRIINRLSFLKHPLNFLNSRRKRKKINEFKNRYLKISPHKYSGEIYELEESYDIIIAGSDQIWNTDLNFGTKTFFLNFKTNAIKTGYAISVGRENFSDLDSKMMHQHIGNFDMISVRENNLRDYLKNTEDIECEVVCDPVFLLNRSIWNEISVSPIPKNYILVYAMECNENLIKLINKLKKQTGKKVFFIYGGGGKINNKYKKACKIISAIGPDEFIGWIKNADIVLTNSFHGAAFSIIFNRELYILEHSTRNVRLTELLDICGYKNKIIKLKNTDYHLNNYSVNTNSAYKNLDGFINKSKEYMLKICQEHINE